MTNLCEFFAEIHKIFKIPSNHPLTIFKAKIKSLQMPAPQAFRKAKIKSATFQNPRKFTPRTPLDGVFFFFVTIAPYFTLKDSQ